MIRLLTLREICESLLAGLGDRFRQLLGAMADRVSDILIDYRPTETSKDETDWSAIMDAAPFVEPQTLSDVAFLLLLAHNQMGYLADLCDTETTPELRRSEAERYRRPITSPYGTQSTCCCAKGAKLCPRDAAMLYVRLPGRPLVGCRTEGPALFGHRNI